MTPDDVTEGVLDADFTFNFLGARSAYVVSDRHPSGEELAGGFTQGFAVQGGKIVGTNDIPNGNSSFISDLAVQIATTNPDAVFYGGITESGAGLLKAQLVKSGYTGPFVSGEGIEGDPDFLTQAGDNAASNSFASVPALDLAFSSSDAASRFIQDYSVRYPGEEDLDSHTAEAYDAAMVLITAIKQLIEGASR
jgi:ABC-type branched-subunit amino acid transport system substrate-binding protein